MYIIISLIIVVIIIFILNEIYQAKKRNSDRKAIFEMAEKRSIESKLPLIVIGDPYNGIYSRMYGPAYTCGDICIDLTGCPKCPSKTMKMKGDIIQELKKLPDNSAVIFISCVLEYIDGDMDEAIKQIYRVSGGSNNIFITSVSSKSILTMLFYRDWINNTHTDIQRYILTKHPPFFDTIEYQKIR
jgi:hypothetical protein